MINKINLQLGDLVTGKVSVNLQYNTDVIYQGDGIYLDKSVPNKIKVTNTVQTYNLDLPSDLNGAQITATAPLNISITSPGVVFLLEKYTNMCRIYTTGTAGGDLKIFIDDSSSPFAKGQSVRLVLPNLLDLAGRNIQFFTDSTNRKGYGTYGITIGNVHSTDLMSNRPILEVTCLDSNAYSFAIDILR